MNYWHLQLHPSDRGKFDKNVLVRILKEKLVIGMGDTWNDRNGNQVQDPLYFKRDMNPDDVVLIRDGSTPIALTKVIGKWYVENNVNPSFDWFKLRRPIELLKVFENGDEVLLKEALKKHDKNHIQAPGTLTLCNGKNATNDFIKLWHLHVQKEMIMKNINLTPERIKDINSLWEDYKNTFTDHQLKMLELDIEKLQEDCVSFP